jgi:hypothetical protein
LTSEHVFMSNGKIYTFYKEDEWISTSSSYYTC